MFLSKQKLHYYIVYYSIHSDKNSRISLSNSNDSLKPVASIKARL